MSEAIPEPTADPMPEPTRTPEPAPPASWRDALDVDRRSNPSLEKFKDVDSLAKSYVEVERLVGKKGVIPPGENATPEQIDAYHSALGRPDSVDGYEVDSIEVPDVLQSSWDMNGVGAVAEEAHRLGVTKDQFRGLVSKLAEVQAGQVGERVQSVQATREQTENSLKEKWGAAYAPNVDLAKRAFVAAAQSVGVDPSELAGSLLPDGGTIGDNPILAQIFAKLGQGGSELALIGGKGGGSSTLTPAQAASELEEINANPALYDSSMPGHKQLVDRRDALYRQQYPDISGDAA